MWKGNQMLEVLVKHKNTHMGKCKYLLMNLWIIIQLLREEVAKMKSDQLIKARYNRILEITKKWKTFNCSNHPIIVAN